MRIKKRRLPWLALFCAWAAHGWPEAVSPSEAWVAISISELREGYDTIWAVSDVHGRLRELRHLLRAADLAVPAPDGSEMRWKPGLSRQLFLVVGDSIVGGPDSRGVILLLKKLQPEAAAAGSRVIVLLGNHEAGFLARLHGVPDDDVSAFIRGMPVAAFVGSWMFAHSGYIDAPNDEESLRAYFAKVASDWTRGEYGALLGRRSILESHNWWARPARRSKVQKRLRTLGLDGLVFGHDPDALGLRKSIAIDADGWLIKIDTGLKTRASKGMLLRCEVGRILRGAHLAMMDQGSPTCQATKPDGSAMEIPVR